MHWIIRLLAVAVAAAGTVASVTGCGSSAAHHKAAASASASVSAIQHDQAVRQDEKLISRCEKKNGAATRADWEKNLKCAGFTSPAAKLCATKNLKSYFLSRVLHHQKGRAESLVIALAKCRTAK